MHDVYLYEQIQNTYMPGNDNLWVRQNKNSRVYRLDRTGIGYCDKDTIYKVHWREVKEKFRVEVFVCVPRRLAVTFRLHRSP